MNWAAMLLRLPTPYQTAVLKQLLRAVGMKDAAEAFSQASYSEQWHLKIVNLETNHRNSVSTTSKHLHKITHPLVDWTPAGTAGGRKYCWNHMHMPGFETAEESSMRKERASTTSKVKDLA